DVIRRFPKEARVRLGRGLFRLQMGEQIAMPNSRPMPAVAAGVSELRELSVGVRKSETVALRHPVMPVGNGFGGRVVGINSRQLGQGDGHGVRPCQRISTSISAAQVSSGAIRWTSTVSPFLRGETIVIAMHLA